MKRLEDQRVFYTFTVEDDKTMKLFFKGLPEVAIGDIAADHKRHGLSVTLSTLINVSGAITTDTHKKLPTTSKMR